MHLCMKHRFEDEHDCKPIKKTAQYEKIKKHSFNFQWNMGGSKKSIKKTKSDDLSFGDKVLRFFVCCGGEKTKPKEDKNRRPPPQQKGQERGNL